MLKLNAVQKYYGSFLALEVPSLIIEDGNWLLHGINGSGKTTFLKMIGGLHYFKGDIILEDKWNIKKQRQQFLKVVNYAEAEPLYPSFLTAKDLVELYCETKGGNLAKAQELLKQLNVFNAYTQKLGSYSSGMIKKLSLVLAFIGKPKLILLDEPLITIDTNAVDTICDIITSYRKSGVSFIITSHQPISAEQLTLTGKLVAENKTIIKA